MKLFKHGIIYRTYDFVKSYIEYRKTRNAIKDVFYGDDFTMVIKRYLNVDLDKDWLGRLYGVINPNVDIKGNLNVNNVIIEIGIMASAFKKFMKTLTTYAIIGVSILGILMLTHII